MLTSAMSLSAQSGVGSRMALTDGLEGGFVERGRGHERGRWMLDVGRWTLDVNKRRGEKAVTRTRTRTRTETRMIEVCVRSTWTSQKKKEKKKDRYLSAGWLLVELLPIDCLRWSGRSLSLGVSVVGRNGPVGVCPLGFQVWLLGFFWFLALDSGSGSDTPGLALRLWLLFCGRRGGLGREDLV